MAEIVDWTKQYILSLIAQPAPPETEVTLLWIRDHYDTNKNRLIDHEESLRARTDYFHNKTITVEQVTAVTKAYNSKTLLPAYPSTPTPTPTPTPPPSTPSTGGDPGTSSIKKNLTAGNYSVVVLKPGYHNIEANISVSSAGRVTCNSVNGGSCPGSGYPRVETGQASVKVYLSPSGTAPTPPPSGGGTDSGNLCGWITSKGGWKSMAWSNIMELYDSFLDPGSYNVGFVVEWTDVMKAYDYFLDQPSGTPSQGNAGQNGCGFT